MIECTNESTTTSPPLKLYYTTIWLTQRKHTLSTILYHQMISEWHQIPKIQLWSDKQEWTMMKSEVFVCQRASDETCRVPTNILSIYVCMCIHVFVSMFVWVEYLWASDKACRAAIKQVEYSLTVPPCHPCHQLLDRQTRWLSVNFKITS